MSEEQDVFMGPVSADELEESFSIPAPSANRFFLNLGRGGVRIAFAEQVPGSKKLFLRSAVVLAAPDAVQLYKIVQRIIKPFEDALKIEDAQKMAQAAHEKTQKDG